MKPVIKWVGGKRQLLPDIMKLIPDFSTYYEPFVGGAAVLLSVEPSKAIINDYNQELSNLYDVIKSSPDALIFLLEKHKQNNTSEYYYRLRNIDRDPSEYGKLTSVERAARLIYLNKVCFNGLYRVNSKGEFNSPYGKYVKPSIYSEDDILSLHRYLNRADIRILTGDFENAVSTAGSGDFVYFDPPYYPISKTSAFTGYSDKGFSENDQIRLKSVCDALTEKNVKFLLSNSYCPFILELYKEYQITTVDASRAINSKGVGRGKIKEVLVRNYKIDGDEV